MPLTDRNSSLPGLHRAKSGPSRLSDHDSNYVARHARRPVGEGAGCRANRARAMMPVLASKAKTPPSNVHRRARRGLAPAITRLLAPRVAMVALALAGVLAVGSTAAYAAGSTGSGGASSSAALDYQESANVSTVKVPTKIPTVLGLDGKVYTPSADALYIENQGADEVKWTGIKATTSAGLGGSDYGADVPDTYSVVFSGYDTPASQPTSTGSATQQLQAYTVKTDGTVSATTGDFSKYQNIASGSKAYFGMSVTVGSKLAQDIFESKVGNALATKSLGSFTFEFDTTKPKVMFAVYTSGSDSALRLYNRSDVPQEGGTYDGHSVTKVWKQGDSYTTTYYAMENGKPVQKTYAGTVDFVNMHIIQADLSAAPPASELAKLPWYSYKDSVSSFIFEDELPIKYLDYWFYNDMYMSILQKVDFSKFTGSSLISAIRTFSDCQSLKNVTFSPHDLPELEDISGMFKGCTQLTQLALAGVTAPKLKSAEAFASSCNALTSFSFADSSAPSLTNLSKCFYNCKELSVVLMDGLEAPKLSNVSEMFSGCAKYNGSSTVNVSGQSKTYGLGGLANSPLENVSGMFSGNSNLSPEANSTPSSKDYVTSFDVSELDLSRVTNAKGMFSNRTKATTIKLPASVSGTALSDVSEMFKNDLSLTGIQNLEGFKMLALTTADSMFENCRSITNLGKLTLGGTSWTANSMFKGMSSLQGSASSPVVSFSSASGSAADAAITGLTSANNMFQGCSKLSYLDLKPLDASKVISATSCFEGCSWLTSSNLKLPTAWPSLINAASMFKGCWMLTAVSMQGFANSPLKDMSSMFEGCSQLSTLDLSGLSKAAPTTVASMFKGDAALTTVTLKNVNSALNTANVTDFSNLFNGCTQLATINGLSDVSLLSASTVEGMFQGASKLTQVHLTTGSSSPANAKNMFKGASSLEDIDLGGLKSDRLGADSVDGMFDTGRVLQKFYLRDSFNFVGKASTIADSKGLLPAPSYNASDAAAKYYVNNTYFCDNDYGDHLINQIPDAADRKSSATRYHLLTPVSFVSRFIWSAPDKTIYVARLHTNANPSAGSALSSLFPNIDSSKLGQGAVLTSIIKDTAGNMIDPENITDAQAESLDFSNMAYANGATGRAEKFVVLTDVYPTNTTRWLAGGKWDKVDMALLHGEDVVKARSMCEGVEVDTLDLSSFKTGNKLADMVYFMMNAKVREVILTGIDFSDMDMGEHCQDRDGNVCNAQYWAFKGTSTTLRKIVLSKNWKWYSKYGTGVMGYYPPTPEFDGVSGGWRIEGYNSANSLGGMELVKYWDNIRGAVPGDIVIYASQN